MTLTPPIHCGGRYAAANPAMIRVREKKHVEGHHNPATHYSTIEQMVASVAAEAKPFEESVRDLLRQRHIEECVPLHTPPLTLAHVVV